jgi:hypothetical protein
MHAFRPAGVSTRFPVRPVMLQLQCSTMDQGMPRSFLWIPCERACGHGRRPELGYARGLPPSSVIQRFATAAESALIAYAPPEDRRGPPRPRRRGALNRLNTLESRVGIWCVDYKGKFTLRDRRSCCYPHPVRCSTRPARHSGPEGRARAVPRGQGAGDGGSHHGYGATQS